MPKQNQEKNKKHKDKGKNNIASILKVTIFLLFLISIFTRYEGTVDIGDYADVAKFFSGNYQANLRSSHSIFYGLLHSPFVALTSSFLFMKISSVFFLSLLIISIYYMSNKDKRTLLLFITTPILWYMAPYINPIQLSSLLFLWGYWFIKKYQQNNKLKNLLFSGLLIGLSWAFWDAVVYFAFFLALAFFYDKKLTHFLLFSLVILIGNLPRLIIDQIIFNFAFYSVLKHFFAVLASTFFSAIPSRGIFQVLNIQTFLFLLIIPFYSFLLYTKKLSRYRREAFFILVSIMITILNGSQIRYTLIFIPIIIIILGKNLKPRQFKIQIVIFLILTLLVIEPYLIQMKYETNAVKFNYFILNLPKLQLNSTFTEDLILQDLDEISREYPNEKFVVGNKPDSYQKLAHLYWGKEIEEFVSIQDYELFLKNQTIIIGKTLCSRTPSWNRRDICISAELRNSISDQTDYETIRYALSLDDNIDLENFKLVKKYRVLSLFEKT